MLELDAGLRTRSKLKGLSVSSPEAAVLQVVCTELHEGVIRATMCSDRIQDWAVVVIEHTGNLAGASTTHKNGVLNDSLTTERSCRHDWKG